MMTSFNDLPIEIIRLIFEYFTSAEIVYTFSSINTRMESIAIDTCFYIGTLDIMFLNIDYAKRAADRDQRLANMRSHVTTAMEDDDIDYEQLFDDCEIIATIDPKPEIQKPVKRVRFASVDDYDNSSPTPDLHHPASERPTFEVEFDFDSLGSPLHEHEHPYPVLTQKPMDNYSWKNEFLNDLKTAKTNEPTTTVSSSVPDTIDYKLTEDTLWDYLKQSNPELYEKLQQTYKSKQQCHDKLLPEQKLPLATEPVLSNEGSPTRLTTKFEQPAISVIEIRLENDAFNDVHEELLRFLLPYHKILCEEKVWPLESSFTSPNVSFQLINTICNNEKHFKMNFNRSDILKHLMFIYTITSFLYVFAYCSLQTAIRHVENIIVQNMKHVCIDQECGAPLFDLLTKTHQQFETILHPKIRHIKTMLMDFFEKRRQLISTQNHSSQPKFLLLVPYESIELLHDIERGLSSIIELRSHVYDKQNSINVDEFNDLFMYDNMIIIRTRHITPSIITRSKRLTLIIEYEYVEQMSQWYQFCQQEAIGYLAYRTVLPLFIPPNETFVENSRKNPTPILKDELNVLPTVIIARPLVDNFKLLRTLECRHDLTILTRDYHLLGIPTEQQPDILIDCTTSMLIFDLNTKLDIDLLRQKILSITLHSCRIHVSILTSGSIPDFLLSTYIKPISQLAKQIQENETNMNIQIKSFSSLDGFANYVALLVHQTRMLHCVLTPTASWNEKTLLRRCSSLNSISAQVILQRLKNVDLSTVNIEQLSNRCPEIPVNYLKKFISDLHRNA